jgi:hypothetical protein
VVGRFGTDKAGYAELFAAGRRHEDRVWAVEGCNGMGKHIAHRLVHDGETVVVNGLHRLLLGTVSRWRQTVPVRGTALLGENCCQVRADTARTAHDHTRESP